MERLGPVDQYLDDEETEVDVEHPVYDGERRWRLRLHACIAESGGQTAPLVRQLVGETYPHERGALLVQPV